MQIQNLPGSHFRRRILPALAIWLLVGMGCHRPPQIAQDNRRLITSLRTAVAAHKVDWLDLNAAAIDERHAAGGLSEDQYAALKSIVQRAREGKWAEAEAEVIQLAKVQQPTGDDSESRARQGS